MKNVVEGKKDALDGAGGSDILAALRAGRACADVDVTEINGIPHAVVPVGVSLVSMEDTMSTPARAKVARNFEEPVSFCGYISQFATPCMRLYGNPDKHSVTAILDDHTRDEPHWCSHTALLQLRKSPEWEEWVEAFDKPFGQSDLADFLEGHIEQIATPDAGDLLSDIRSIHISTNTKCESVQREGGDITFTYSTDTSAGTRTERGKIPSRLTLVMAPFRSWGPVQMTVTLSYKHTKEKGLYFVMKPLQLDTLLYASYTDIRKHIEEKAGLPILV